MKLESIKNLEELIEGEGEYEEVLRLRLKNISNFPSLGPPDLCYLTKTYQGSLLSLGGGKKKMGSYHYVYGLDLSTPASVSAYINGLIGQQEIDESRGKLFSGEGWVITKGYFCIFDSFSRIDVHLEISIPGTMKLYGFTSENNIVTVNDKLWERAYVSSTMRAMKPSIIPVGKIFEELHTEQQMAEFLKSFFNLVKDQDLKADPGEDEQQDYYQNKGSRALTIVTEYLFRKKRFLSTFEQLSIQINQNPKLILFLAKLYEELKRYQDAMRIYAFYLVKIPSAPTLLYNQADLLLKKQKYEESYKLAIDLCHRQPDNFDNWMLLANLFLAIKNFPLVFLVLNEASKHSKKGSNRRRVTQNYQQNYMYDLMLERQQREITKPKNKGTSDMMALIMILSEEPQLWGLRKQPEINPQDTKSLQFIERTNEKQLQEMKQLKWSQLSQDEKRIYQTLVTVERELGYDKLMKQKELALCSKQGEQQGIQVDYDFPLILINEYREMGNERLQEKQQEENEDQGMPHYDDTQYSDGGEDNLPQFLKNDELDVQVQRQTINNPRKKKANTLINLQRTQPFVNNKWENSRTQHITEKTDETLESERPVFQKGKVNQSHQTLLNKSHTNQSLFKLKIKDQIPIKFQSPQTEELTGIIDCLQEDLGVLMAWQNEEQGSDPIRQVNKVNNNRLQEDWLHPNIWLQRAELAERLQRKRFIEKAYQKVVERAYCFQAWQKLLQFHTDEDNPKHVLVTIAEILDDMESCGVKKFQYMPAWIEKQLLKLVSNRGMIYVKKLLNDIKFDDETVNACLEKAIYWKSQGYNGYNNDQ